MGVFFSGTDQQELHDNVHNHNYYLSLIVNFQDPGNWKAKIVFLGTEKRTGTVIKTFKGTNGLVTKEVDISREEEVMYSLDCELYLEDNSSVEQHFIDRVKNLKKKKTEAKFNTYTHRGEWYQPYTGNKVSKTPGMQLPFYFEGGDDVAYLEPNRITVQYGEENVRGFIRKLLSLDPKTTLNLYTVLSNIQKVKDFNERSVLIQKINEEFDDIFKEHFGVEAGVESRSLVCKKAIIILEKLENTYPICKELIVELENEYVLW